MNYHVIFSNEIAPEIIESQFLSALCSKYVLTPEFDELRTSGKWAAVPTRQSIEDLGQLIIKSVPAAQRAKYGAPIIEGFNNLCLNLHSIEDVLRSHYFAGKTLTVDDWAKAQKSLTDGGVNDRLLDCSDAHQYADAVDKD